MVLNLIQFKIVFPILYLSPWARLCYCNKQTLHLSEEQNIILNQKHFFIIHTTC